MDWTWLIANCCGRRPHRRTFSPQSVAVRKRLQRLPYGPLLDATGVLQEFRLPAAHAVARLQRGLPYYPTTRSGVQALERRTPGPLPACGNLPGTRTRQAEPLAFLLCHTFAFFVKQKSEYSTKKTQSSHSHALLLLHKDRLRHHAVNTFSDIHHLRDIAVHRNRRKRVRFIPVHRHHLLG